jgi:hypothetical protein
MAQHAVHIGNKAGDFFDFSLMGIYRSPLMIKTIKREAPRAPLNLKHANWRAFCDIYA